MSRRVMGPTTLRRCWGCGQHLPGWLLRTVPCADAPGGVRFCADCWWDIREAVRSGAHEQGYLLELIASFGARG
jgi:hypothetical protein